MNEDVAALVARPGVAPWRIRLAMVIESGPATRAVVAVILANAVLMGLETHAPLMASHGELIRLLDTLCLVVFVVELVIKLAAYQGVFFRSGWRVFDLLVVAVALVPGAGPWAVLRSLRVLRVLRLLTVVPTLRRVVTAFLRAIPGLLGVIAVMLIVFYTSAVLATTLYAEDWPDYFGDLPASLYTLFQIMTLDSWFSSVVRPMVAEDPTAGPFFLVFVVVTSFTVLNLFIGVIVTAMQEMGAAEERAAQEKAAAQAVHRASKELADDARRDAAVRDATPPAVRAESDGSPPSHVARPGEDAHAGGDGTPSAADVEAIIARMEADLETLRRVAARG